MAQRGRKSAAALAIAPVVERLDDRPSPPLSLNERATDEWHRVVNRMPSDWFTDETVSTLQTYCEYVAEAEAVQMMIEKVRPTAMKDDEAFDRYEKLTRTKDRLSKGITSVARKLRLLPQSRYTAQAAASATKGGKGRKPWDD